MDSLPSPPLLKESNKVVSGGVTGTPEKYRKVPKFSDARKLCHYQPKSQAKRQDLRVFHQKDESVNANSEDPDQTLIWVITFCPDLSV